jgi:hypothetical protein
MLGGKQTKVRLSQSGASIEFLTILMELNPIMLVLMLPSALHSHHSLKVGQSCALQYKFDRWVPGMNGAGKGSPAGL